MLRLFQKAACLLVVVVVVLLAWFCWIFGETTTMTMIQVVRAHRQSIISRRFTTTSSSSSFACHQRLVTHQWKASRRRPQQQQQWFHLAAEAGSRSSDADKDRWYLHDSHESLERVQEAIFNLTNGPININSPKQVSHAIFGKTQSTSRSVLQQAADGKMPNLNQQSQRLAALVLQYRQLYYKTTTSSISISASASEHSSTTNPVVQSAASTTSSSTLLVSGESRSFSSVATNAAEASQKGGVTDSSDGIFGDMKPPNNEASSSPTLNDINEICDSSSVTTAAAAAAAAGATTTISPYDLQVEALFSMPKSKIHEYWKEPLLQLTRPSARSLVAQLNAQVCPNGYDPLAAAAANPLLSSSSSAGTTTTTSTAGKKGSFLAYCREQKEKYPDCVVLTRCGDFYETFGIDAILLVEHCGLNPMGYKAKAGCPVRNVQATIDGLTQQGFRVAVFEEASDTDASAGSGAAGGSKSRIKNRFLAQIVSSASPTYLYDLILLGNTDALATAQPSRPYVGVMSLSAGYTLVEVSVEERSVRVSSRLTAEAVAARLAAFPPADPLFYVPSPKEYESLNGGAALSLPFLPSRRDASLSGPGARLRTRIIPPTLVPGPAADVDDVERAKTTIVSAVLQVTESLEEESRDDDRSSTAASNRRAAVDDFTLVSSQSMNDSSMEKEKEKVVVTHPLHVETAKQLGLMDDQSIPSLIAHILPNSAPAPTKRFLRRFLLTPPPPVVGNAMAQLVLFLKNQGPALPPLTVPPIGKILALLRAKQASAQVYGELMHSMNSALVLLDELNKTYPEIVRALMTLLEYESGLAADSASLQKRCHLALETVESVVSPLHHARGGREGGDFNNGDFVSDFGSLIPQGFFERNEATWRGRVRPDSAPASYAAVERAVKRLAVAVAVDFWKIPASPEGLEIPTSGKSPIVQDIFNNLITIKQIPDGLSKNDKVKYKHPRDRFGKVLRNRYTTESVEEALSDYVEACETARREVASALADLSLLLHDEEHIPAIVQSAHINLIVSAAFHHAAKAATMGWNMARTFDENSKYGPENQVALHLEQLHPYWMSSEESVANTIQMDGLFLLTAPNMSGKSTLMRSTAAAALLSVCGLCAPLGAASLVKRFDHIFVRGASADVPTEQKSAFGAEMEDIASLLRSCGGKSLVFVDELGRGTSPRDGTRIAGAVLEALSTKGMNGIFATHLHDILALPLKASDRIKTKRMAIHDAHESSHSYTWTYRMEDGVCRDSMALITAAKFGLPIEVLRRAEELGSFLPDTVPNCDDLDDSTDYDSMPRPRNVTQEVNGDLDDSLVIQQKDASELAQSVLVDITDGEVTRIPAMWNPPPGLSEGQTCVYILELYSHSQRQPHFYVGETDNLRQRLDQHRRKKGGGLQWRELSTIVVPAPGKSQARAWESVIIRRLAQAGLTMVSTADGRRTLSP